MGGGAGGRAALIDALVRSALRGAGAGAGAGEADELQRQQLHNRLASWALRVLGSHLSAGSGSVGTGGGGGFALGDAGSVVQAMKQLLRQQQRDAEAGT